MTMQIKLTAVVTAVDIGTPVAMDATPFLGGKGRNAILSIPTLPGTSTVLIQGAPKTSTGAEPVEGDASWTTLATLTSASEKQFEIELPDFIRWNTTVLHAAAPNVIVYIEGVQ